jgi:hopanoid biosynthesis associated RND transporter like protein HpnN
VSESRPDRAGRLLAGTAAVARRFAWAVLAAALALTGLLGWYTVTNLGMNSDTAGLLSPDLPFRQRSRDFKAAFPHDSGRLAIVLDGANEDAVADGSAKLAAALKREPKIFATVFYPDAHPFFRRNGLLFLDLDELAALAERLAEAQPLLGTLAEDPSMRGLFAVLGLAAKTLREGTEDANTKSLALALDKISAVVEGRAAGKPRALSWLDLMRARPPKPGDKRRIIVVQPSQDFSTLQPGKRAMKRIRAVAKTLGLTPERGVRVRLTGTVALNTEELKSVEAGAGTAGFISLGLVAVFLIAGLRSLRLVAAVLITLIIGLVWTGAFATAAIGELNLISVAFAVLFIGLGADFGIHYALRFREAAAQGDKEPLGAAARGVGPPIALATATTSVAFLAFVPTDYRGISELGIIAAAGMVIAFVLNLTLLPALIALFRIRAKPAPAAPSAIASAPDRLIRGHARTICLVAIVLGLAAAPLAAFMRFDHNPLNLKDFSTESVQTVLELTSETNASPFTASVLTASLKAADALAARFEKLSTVDKAITLSNFVPEKQREKLEIVEQAALFLTPTLDNPTVKPAPDVRARRIAYAKFQGELASLLKSGKAGALEPGIRRLSRALGAYAARTKFSDTALLTLDRALTASFPARLVELKDAMRAKRVALADLPAVLRNQRIAADGRVRIEIFPKSDLTRGSDLRQFVTQVRGVAPAATDAPVDILEGGRVVVAAFYQATGTALIAIVLLLFMLLRRFWDVALVMAPLALAALLAVAAARLAGLDLNLANIIVLPLLLGLGVDSGIHLVMRARGESVGEGDGEALLRTSTPRAVFFSALTTVGSFGALATSGHRGTASMGLFLTIAIAMTLLCMLVVLPAMMAWRERGRGA